MKYEIKIARIDTNAYCAYCPVIGSIRVRGKSFEQALDSLHRAFLCYLHDPAPEFEIVMEKAVSQPTIHTAPDL